MGKPFEAKDFKHYTVGDINVYMPERIKARNDKISISYSKFLWMKSLSIDGII